MHADDLTARLAPESGEFFPSLWYLDRVDVPGGAGDANVTLALGLGLRCEGDPSVAVPGPWWVECAVRLVRDPTALSRDRRALEAGFDFQILSSRTPTEAVEWRVLVESTRANGSFVVAFDSGWRTFDFSPMASVPTLSLQVTDPCDRDDRLEDEEIWGPRSQSGRRSPEHLVHDGPGADEL